MRGILPWRSLWRSLLIAACWWSTAAAEAQLLPSGPTPLPSGPRSQPPKRDPLPPPVPDEEWFFGLEARSPILKGDPASFNPPMGLGIGVHFGKAYRSWFRLRIAVDYDRVFSTSSIALPGFGGATVSRSQNLTQASFLGEAMFRLPYRWFAAHLLVGGGLFVGFFGNAAVEDSQKLDRKSLLPGVRLEAGFTFRVHRHVELGVAFGYDFRRDQTTVPTSPLSGAPQKRPFDDQMSLGLRIDYLF